ncbi:MAG TPA: hypothetical protein VK857_04770 [Desulforhopalus sp.]|nr:hypothetical protein [Desulforhopalus sp.]
MKRVLFNREESIILSPAEEPCPFSLTFLPFPAGAAVAGQPPTGELPPLAA